MSKPTTQKTILTILAIETKLRITRTGTSKQKITIVALLRLNAFIAKFRIQNIRTVSTIFRKTSPLAIIDILGIPTIKNIIAILSLLKKVRILTILRHRLFESRMGTLFQNFTVFLEKAHTRIITKHFYLANFYYKIRT